jgi:hypothetical protein
MNARLPLRRRSSGQADVSTIIILASLCAAVFASSFLVGRATSPHAQAVESRGSIVGAVVAGVPVKMSSAPAIAPAILPRRRRERPGGAVRTTPAASAAVPVVRAPEPAVPQPAAAEPVRTSPPANVPEGGGGSGRATPSTPTSTTPGSSGGPGTSFDTSG